MTARHWLDSNGNWTTATDWTGDVVPGPTDEAVLDAGSYTVSEDSSSTGPINVDSIEISAGAVLVITNVAGNQVGVGGVTNGGTLALDGTAALTITGGVANSGSLDLDTNYGDGGGSLTIGDTLANTGAVQVGSTSSNLSAPTSLTLGGLTNAIGASFEVFGSAAHPATLVLSSGGAGFSENDGTFVLSDTAPLSLPDSTFTNKGTLALDGTAALTITGGVANSGSLDLDTNYGDGGGSLTIGDTLANTGAVQVGSTSSNLSAPTSLTLGGLTNAIGASFEVFGSAAHPATLVLSSGGAGFSENDGTFVLSDTAPLSLPDSTFTNKGTLALDGTAALTITGGVANSGSLDLDTNYGDGGGSLTIGDTLANTGAVQVGSTSSNLSAPTSLTLGGLTNAIGASFEVFGSAAHPATLVLSSGGAGFSENDGTFVLSDTAPLSLPDSTFTNKGTLALDGTAALTITGGVANSGSLDLDTNYGDGGGSLTIGDTLANTGAVQVGSTSSNLSAPTSLTLGGLTNAIGASFEVFGSAAHPATLVLSSGGAGFSENDGTFVLSDTAPLSLPDSTFTNKGTLALDGTAALTITGGVANSGSLDLDTNYGDGGGSLTIGDTLANTGAVQVGSTSSNLSAPTSLTLGGLTNAIGASFEVFGSAAHPATLVLSSGGAGFSENDGTFVLSDTAPLSLPDSTFTNKGTLALDGTAALTITGGVANSGSLDLDTNYGDGGGSLTIGDTLANTGAVQVGSTSSNLSAPTSLTLGGLTNAIGASFEVFGSAAHPATLVLSSGGAGFSENDGTFVLSDTAPLSLPDSTFTNKGTLALDGTAALTITGGVANSGSLDLDTNYGDGGGSLTIGDTLANTGAVQVGSTSSNLSAPTSLTLGGLTNAIGASFEVFGSAAHPATLVLSSGGAGFSENDGTFVLSDTAPLSLPDSTFTNKGTLALDGTAALTITGGVANSGSLDLDTNYGDGGGSLTIGDTLANTGAVQVGSTSSNLSAPTSLTLGGLTNAIGASFEVFGSAAHPATLTVNGPAVNSGTIDVGSFSVFDVTAGKAFTQKAGTTTVNGAFIAATIAIDGGTFAVDTTNFTNIGTMTAADGGKIDFSAGGLTNLSGTTLKGGTYVVDAGSTLQLPNNTTIVTLAANLTLSGTGSVMQSLDTSTSAEVTIESTLTTIAAGGALSVLGGRPYTTTDAITDSGSLAVGGGSTFTAAALNVAAGGKLLVDAGATLSLGSPLIVAGTATNAGTINGGGATAVTMAAGAGRLILDPGFAFGGEVAGGGKGSTLELAKGSMRGIVNALGTNFTNFGTVTVDAGATWTVEALASALSGATITGSDGANILALTSAGTVALAGVSQFPTINLAAGNNSVTVTDNTLSGGSVTIKDGASGNNIVSAAGDTVASAGKSLTYIAGSGTDSVTGGFENDVVNVSAAAVGGDIFTGGSGTDTLDMTTAGTVVAGGISGVEVYELASGAANSLSLVNANFTGVTGASITVYGGTTGNTVDASGLSAPNRVVMVGGAGKDVFTGGAGNDVFEFTVAALAASDTVAGGAGSDQLVMITAGTVLAGGVSGVEVYELASGAANSLSLVSANFTGVTGASITVYGGTAGNTVDASGLTAPNRAVMVGGAGKDVFTGGAGNDVFEFTVAALAASDTVAGGAGSDQLVMTTAGTVLAGGISGVETYYLANGGANNLTLIDSNFTGVTGSVIRVNGGSAGNTVNASGAANRVVMVGGAGKDVFTGGTGSDIFMFTAATLAATDTVVGGSGNDYLDMTTAGTAEAGGVSGVEVYELANGAANSLTLTNANFTGVTGASVTVYGGTAGNTVDASGLTAPNRAVMVGGAGKDAFTGGAGNDVFEFTVAALAASDTVAGGAGSDQLLMTSAGTVLAGGISGVETYNLANGGANNLTLGNGNFTGVTGSVIRVNGGNAGNTVDAAELTGANRVIVVGGAGKDVFTGGAGSDIFMFTAATLAATDTVVGGAGNDYLDMTTAGTVLAGGVSGVEVYELANGAANSLTLTNANFTGVTGASVTVYGGTTGNTVDASGLTAPNRAVMVGGAGKDVFTGGAGNDVFEFTAAALAASDTVAGGAGSDQLLMTSAGTVLAGGVSGVETYNLANGGANNLTLGNGNFTGVTGSVIRVNGGNAGNTVDAAELTGANRVIVVGGAGKDVFTGGAGSDIFMFTAATLAATDTVAGGAGNDYLDMTTAGTVLAGGVSGVEVYELANGAANSLSLVNANFTGVTGASITVYGGTAGNTVDASGLTAPNRAVMVGGAGKDVFTGGAGNDVFEFTVAALAASDTVAGGAGSDQLVMATAGTVLAGGISGVETYYLANGGANNLTLIDSNFTGVTGSVIRVNGGSAGNTVNASGAANRVVMVGGAGKDVFTGGTGSDIFMFTAATLAATDTVVGGSGNDYLDMTTAGTAEAGGVSGVEVYELANGAANSLTLTNANFTGVTGASVTVYGGTTGNTVDASGLTAPNRAVMVGGAGKDVFTGGAGNDVFEFTAAALAASDTVAGGAGSDQLLMTSAGTVLAGGVSGVETYNLANGGANNLTLGNGNFTGVTGSVIRVNGGNAGNTVNALGLTGANRAVLVGGAGADTLIAGPHAAMTGGGGADLFELTTPGSAAVPDTNTIADFAHASDEIAFSNAGFGLGLAGASATPQHLPVSLFSPQSNGSFTTTTQRFAYNSTSGTLSYDADGSGAGASRLIATLTTLPTLAASDLFFVA